MATEVNAYPTALKLSHHKKFVAYVNTCRSHFGLFPFPLPKLKLN